MSECEIKIEFFNAALKKKPQVRERERDKFSKNLQHLTILIPLDHRLIGDFFITFKEGNNNKKNTQIVHLAAHKKKLFFFTNIIIIFLQLKLTLNWWHINHIRR